MIKALFSLSIAAGLASASIAAVSPVELTSDIFVEKLVKQKDGSSKTVLAAPKLITPGDQLVFVVNYKNVGKVAANNFTVTNPIPRAIAYTGTSDGAEFVSIDGGTSWGKLAQLRMKNKDGSSRPALATDVTHIKWILTQTLASGAGGKLIFRGVVK